MGLVVELALVSYRDCLSKLDFDSHKSRGWNERRDGLKQDGWLLISSRFVSFHFISFAASSAPRPSS